LLDVKDSSERDVQLNHKNLCAELTATLKAYLIRIEREKRVPTFRFFRSRAIAPPSCVIRDLGSIGSSSNRPKTIDFTIQGIKDADTALTAWFGASSSAEDNPEKKLFEAKLTQLKRYDEQIEAERKGTSLGSEIATVAGGSIFATTFVFSFARGMLEPRKYTVSLEAKLQEVNSEIVKSLRQLRRRSSVRARSASCIAVVSNLWGILRSALHSGKSAISGSIDAIRQRSRRQQLNDKLWRSIPWAAWLWPW
jgi:hypothetical protein